jgi:hypothetical protein
MVINPQFGGAERFLDGLSKITIGDSTTGKKGYISR